METDRRLKDWHQIKIDSRDLDTLKEIVRKYQGYNPACILGDYWSERISSKIEVHIKEEGTLPYGYVGDGWPQKTDQSKVLGLDTYNYREAFIDFHNRDAGDAIYQANILTPFLGDMELSIIVDIGAGYGRLALPFIYKWNADEQRQITYIGIDYVASSLLMAPQFVEQAVGAKVCPWNSIPFQWKDYDFISLPAWRLDELQKRKIDLFISIHSFQEMTRETVDYYITIINEHKGACFYSVNLWPEKYVPDTWELIFDRAYPINRDGPFSEKLWRVK